MMENASRKVSAALLATFFGAAAYAGAMRWSISGLWYMPLARAWVFGPKPAGLAMSWYGRTGGVLVLALFGALVGHALPKASARLTRGVALLTCASLIVAVSVCVAANVNRPTKPIPLPSGQPVVCAPAT